MSARMAMTAIQDFENIIEKEMEELTKDDYLRPGMAYNDFVGEFSTLLAQTREDDDVLEDAGFDLSILEKGYRCMKMLAEEHAERINAEADESQVSKDFQKQMPVVLSSPCGNETETVRDFELGNMGQFVTSIQGP